MIIQRCAASTKDTASAARQKVRGMPMISFAELASRPPKSQRNFDNLIGVGIVSCGVKLLRESWTLADEDKAEIGAFVEREGTRLLGFAFLLTSNQHDAQDLVQQALLRTAIRWRTARQAPTAYSRTVVLNLVKDRWRARQRQNAETLRADLTDLPSATDAAQTVLDRQLLLYACRLLPLQQRAVLVLRFWEDRPIDETAAILRCTAGTVKSQTHRALARLRDILADLASAPPSESAHADVRGAKCQAASDDSR